AEGPLAAAQRRRVVPERGRVPAKGGHGVGLARAVPEALVQPQRAGGLAPGRGVAALLAERVAQEDAAAGLLGPVGELPERLDGLLQVGPAVVEPLVISLSP